MFTFNLHSNPVGRNYHPQKWEKKGRTPEHPGSTHGAVLASGLSPLAPAAAQTSDSSLRLTEKADEKAEGSSLEGEVLHEGGGVWRWCLSKPDAPRPPARLVRYTTYFIHLFYIHLSTYFVPSPEHTKINSTSVRRLLCTETFRKRDTSFHLRQGLNFCILFASLKAHLWTRLQPNRAGLTVKNAPSSVESRSMTEFRSLGLAWMCVTCLPGTLRSWTKVLPTERRI